MTCIDAIPADHLDDVRRGRPDASGQPPVRSRAEGGEPLRCCLRAAEPGEGILLFGYEPPLPPSPYRMLSAVFAHAEPCDGHAGGYPAAWRSRPQVFRAYDARGWIHPATRLFDGDEDGLVVLAAMVAEPGVEQVFSTNVAYGCYMFRATVGDRVRP